LTQNPRKFTPIIGQNPVSTLRLRLLLPSQQIKELPLSQLLVVPAEQGGVYSVIDSVTQKPVNGIVLKKGDALLIEVDEALVAQIDHFYDEDRAAAFDVGSAGDGEAQLLTSNAPAAEDTGIVWPASEGDRGAAPLSTDSDSNGAMLWGGGLLGGGGLLAAAGGGGGAVAAVNNVVTGAIVGGPVMEGHGLSVQLYKADGTLLGTATVDASGHYRYSVGAYTGVVIAVVVDSDDGDDYLDESTNAGKDLNAELFGMGALTAPSTLQINLNVLTTVAYRKALEAAAGSPLDAAAVANANAAIAQAFGLPDLHSIVVVTTNGTTTYDSSDGLSAGEEIMQIVPVDDELIIEAKVRPADIAQIRPGLQSNIRFDPFDYTIFGSVPGKVIYVSADTLKEDTQRGQEIYYRVHVSPIANPVTTTTGKSLDILPGMTAQVDIRTGDRTLMDVLLKPLKKTVTEAFGER
jgi:hypothetical protein